MLYGVRSLLDKDPQFVSYITNSIQDLAQAKIKSVSSSNQLKMPVENMNPQQLKTFSLIAIDRVNK